MVAEDKIRGRKGGKASSTAPNRQGSGTRKAATSNAAGRPTLAEIERRKENVLVIATELFARQGYAETSLAEIARQAGVATRTLYHHFGDKEELFREVISVRTSNPAGDRPRLIPGETCQDLLFRTANYITDSAIQERSVDIMRLMLAESRRFPELTKKVSDSARNYLLKSVRSVFEELHAAEMIPDDDHEFSTLLFVDLILGFAPIRHYASWERTPPTPEEIDAKIKFFIKGRLA